MTLVARFGALPAVLSAARIGSCGRHGQSPSRTLATPVRSALADRAVIGSMWRLADGEYGGDQVIQRPGQVVLGDQDNLVIDAKMVDRPSRNRVVGRSGQPGRVRPGSPTGRRRQPRRCQPSGAAWCRPG